MYFKVGIAVGVLFLLLMGTDATAGSIGFDDLEHGEIVFDQYLASHGVTITAVNEKKSFDLAVAFDTQVPANETTDDDLRGYPARNWAGGNLAPDARLGKVLIISENDGDVLTTGNHVAGDGILDDPDDEGGRPAGRLIAQFSTPIHAIGWDLIDIESDELNGAWFGAFYLGSTALATVPFANFDTPGNLFYDPSIQFVGDNSANRITPITAAQLSAFTGSTITGFDRVEIRLGGSGAIDNLVYSTPVPSAAWAGLALLAALGMARVSRRRR